MSVVSVQFCLSGLVFFRNIRNQSQVVPRGLQQLYVFFADHFLKAPGYIATPYCLIAFLEGKTHWQMLDASTTYSCSPRFVTVTIVISLVFPCDRCVSLFHFPPGTISIFFVTNNSTKSRKGYKKKFDSLGLVSRPNAFKKFSENAQELRTRRPSVCSVWPAAMFN